MPNEHMKSPCKNCPFTKKSTKGWLGEQVKNYIMADSFVCHKTTKPGQSLKQCAGHMILRKEENAYFRLAKILKLDLGLSGDKRVFDSEDQCIKHHQNKK